MYTIHTLIAHTKETLSQSGLAVLMSGHVMFQGEGIDWKWNVTFTITEGSVQQKDTMVAILDSINRTWHKQNNAELKEKK